ncbi:MAG: PPC domain-containing protein [Phycisphaerales bacterium]
MSQMPPQGPPQYGPPPGPPMGGPPQYGPPPKKKGIVLLVLGLIALVIGGILVIVGVGGGASMVSTLENLANEESTLVAPGEKTFRLQEGGNIIIAWDQLEMGGRTYAPSDQYPTNDTTLTVTNGQGQSVPVSSPDGQASLQIGNNSGRFVGTFDAPSAGNYTLSVTSSGEMDQRAFSLLKESDAMALVGGAFAIFGGICGGFIAVVGIILIVVWLIVRK